MELQLAHIRKDYPTTGVLKLFGDCQLGAVNVKSGRITRLLGY